MKLKFEEDISKENRNVRNLIHHTHYETVGKYLVAKSQDKKHAIERLEKLYDEEMEIQLNCANLVNELEPFQIHQLYTLVNQIIVSE